VVWKQHLIGGVTNQIGTFTFAGLEMVETIYTPSSLTLQTGGMIEFLYGDNGEIYSDHGNINVFINASLTPVPEPTTVIFLALGLAGLIGIRRKMQ
jgi:hypothetical protein